MTNAASPLSDAAFAAARESYLKTGRAGPLQAARVSLVDRLAAGTFAEYLEPAAPRDLAVVAVGGYGRRDLFPHSDVDLLFLTRRPMDAQIRGPLSTLLKRLWDAGLRVSQSVRTVDECASLIEGNLELTISLLDARLLAGDGELDALFRDRFARFLNADRKHILRRLCLQTRARHARYHDTIYRLEPDVKEHPGGLRDLQTVGWLWKLRDGWETPHPAGQAKDFLATVRCHLHLRAGRDSNLLHFEAQDELAAATFSTDHDPAAWMRGYFRQARWTWREVSRELEQAEASDRSLLAGFRDWRARLSNPDFTVARERLFLRNPNDLAAAPELVLRAFLFVARHGIPLAAESEERITAQTPALERYLQTAPPLAPFWRELLGLPHAPRALRLMQDCGVLTLLIPEWRNVEHAVVRDFYHQYTVDEHTFTALDVLARVEAPRFCDLAEEAAGGLWLLRLALLLHDIGKGSGRDHTAEAVRIGAMLAARIGLTAEESEDLVFLIAEHLTLSAILQSRDLDAPETARQAAARVRTVERLRLLTLLTYADSSAVHAAAMTPWRAGQIWHLFRAVARELDRELADERPAGGLPSRYLRTHTAEEIAAHRALHEQSRQSGAAVDITRQAGAFRVTVVTADRQRLFASLAGALSSFGLDILKAEAFTSQDGAIIDTFFVADPLRNLEQNPSELDRLKHTVRRVATGSLRAAELLKSRPVKAPPTKGSRIHPAVTLDAETSAAALLVEVVAQDRPGLLYSLANAISETGCNIEVVLVATEAHKAIDVFHVTCNGAKPPSTLHVRLRAALLAACA